MYLLLFEIHLVAASLGLTRHKEIVIIKKRLVFFLTYYFHLIISLRGVVLLRILVKRLLIEHSQKLSIDIQTIL